MIQLCLQAVAGALAALLLVSAASKIWSREAWRITAVRLAGRGRRGALAFHGLPIAELAVGLACVAAPRPGLVSAAVLLGVFAVGVLHVRGRLEGERCGCFGELGQQRIGLALALRNACLAAAALTAAVLLTGGDVLPGAGAGALAVVALLALARAHSAGGGPGPALRSRAHVPGATSGRAALVAFVAPGCPACHGAIPRLLQIDQGLPALDVVVATAPGDGAGALADALGGLARPDLWEVLRRDWRVPGTPYAVALDADRRVVWTGTGDPAALDLAAAAALSDPAGRISRGEALVMSARTFAAAALAGGLAPAAALAGRRRVPRRRAHSAGAGEVVRDPRNVITGDCTAFRSAVGRGVYDAGGNRLSNVVGYTWVEGLELDAKGEPVGPRLPLGSSVDSRRVTNQWRGRCLCPDNPGEYTDAGQCAADCPNSLLCFGYQCETTFQESCVEVLFSISVAKTPKISITQLEWVPPADASPRCKVYAQSYNNDFVLQHEQHHAQDTLDGIAQFNREHDRQYLKRCARTEEEAQAQIDAEIARQTDAAYDRLIQIDTANTVAFHQSASGRSALPNCAMCE